MWSIAAFGVLLLAGLSSAQNPYALKRPSYCSTCFTNDQRQNYYCCFYFFRCCAESRLGSNNRKVTTPSSEYPGSRTTSRTLSTEEEHVAATKERTLLSPPAETKSEKCIPKNQKTGESARSDSASPCSDERGVLTGTNTQDATSSVKVLKAPQNTSPDAVDNSRPRNPNRFSDPGADRTSSTSYSSPYGGRRYPYNVPRVYSAQQSDRNTRWRTPENMNGGGLTGAGRSKARYGDAFEKDVDSVEGKAQQTGPTGGVEGAGDVFWGRMEPVKEDE